MATANRLGPTGLDTSAQPAQKGPTMATNPLTSIVPNKIAQGGAAAGGGGLSPSIQATSTGGSGSPSVTTPDKNGGMNYGGGTGGGSLSNANTDPMTGFVKQYGFTPLGLQDIYNSPNILANALLQSIGGATTPGLTDLLGQQFNPIQAAMAALTMGGPGGKMLTDNDTMNYIARQMQEMVTPGGTFADPGAVMQAVLGAGGQGGDTSGQGASPLYAFLNQNGSPQANVSAANSMIGNGALNTANPYGQRAMTNFLKNAGTQYQGQVDTGGTGNYEQYLQNSGIGNWFR